jgi:hypothetical protein
MFNGRSAKPWGSFREGAANLDMVASDSRISKATRLIMLASFSLMTMTRMEVVVADPIVTQQVFQVEHVKIDSTKNFAEVEAALDAAIPQLDPAIGAALTKGEEERAKELERGAKSRERDERRATGERPVVGVSACRRRCEAESRGHIHQVGERAGLHFSHHLASVSLHRDLADAELATDLFIQQAGDDQRHDLPFAAAE